MAETDIVKLIEDGDEQIVVLPDHCLLRGEDVIITRLPSGGLLLEEVDTPAHLKQPRIPRLGR